MFNFTFLLCSTGIAKKYFLRRKFPNITFFCYPCFCFYVVISFYADRFAIINISRSFYVCSFIVSISCPYTQKDKATNS